MEKKLNVCVPIERVLNTLISDGSIQNISGLCGRTGPTTPPTSIHQVYLCIEDNSLFFASPSGDSIEWKAGIPLPNKLYKYNSVFYRSINGEIAIVDIVEFPKMSKPMELFDFQYEAKRMGNAPTITASKMWDACIDNMLNDDIFVSFNGERYYLYNNPTSSKSNEDARYKYDFVFQSERVLLENVYMFDSVIPSNEGSSVSESSTFSFFGNVKELANRINMSLVNSGVSNLVPKDNTDPVDVMTYNEFVDSAEYTTYHGSYTEYLSNYYETDENGDFVIEGYHVVVDRNVKLEDFMVSFDNNKVSEALSNIDSVYGLSYYFEGKEIHIGEFQFDVTAKTGITFGYGADDALISIEKSKNSSDKVNRCTGIGSSENIPYYYPNPTEDGWIEPYIESINVKKLNIPVSYISSNDSVRIRYGVSIYSAEIQNYAGDIFTLVAKMNMAVESTGDMFSTDGSTESVNAEPTYIIYLKHIDNNKPLPNLSVVHNGGEQQIVLVNSSCSVSFPSEGEPMYERFIKNRLNDVITCGDGGFITASDYESATFKEEDDGFYYNIFYKIKIYEQETVCSISPISFSGILSNFNTNDVFVLLFDAEGRHHSALAGEIKNALVSIQSKATGGTTITIPNGDYRLIIRFRFASYANVPKQPAGKCELTGRVLTTGENGFVYGVLTDEFQILKSDSVPFGLYYHIGTLQLPLSSVRTFKAKLYSCKRCEQLGCVYDKPAGITDKDALFEDYVTYLDTYLKNIFENNYAIIRGGTIQIKRYIKSGAPGYGTMESNKIAFKKGNTTELLTFDDTDEYKFIENQIHKGMYLCDNSGTPNVIGIVGDLMFDPYDNTAILGDSSQSKGYYYAYTTNAYLNFRDFVSNISFSLFYSGGSSFIRNGKQVNIADYGLSINGSAIAGTTIRFRRTKYVTPQQNLMPELYYKTNGARRFYDAINYPRENYGEIDTAAGEKRLDDNRIDNLLYHDSDDESHPSSRFMFKNLFKKRKIMESIQEFDIKPSITEMMYNGRRIDVVEEFGYDLLDSDETFVSSDGQNQVYHHPYFFAKLRPMGFNLFDMALESGDMEIVMKSGHCGSCKFKIKVDEKTKKNPVQIYEYDVYEKTGDSYTKIYNKGSLARIHKNKDLYYKKSEDVYISIKQRWSDNQINDLDDIRSGHINIFDDSSVIFDGDVITSGMFIDSQQDTTDSFVWVALEKDTNTFGTIMPSCRRYDTYPTRATTIRPKAYTDDAQHPDFFIIDKIRLPLAYIRYAEQKLSKSIVKYMNKNNDGINVFSIKYSRIFFTEHPNVLQWLNENSKMTISYNNTNYVVYTNAITYEMKNDCPLPDINVTLMDSKPSALNYDRYIPSDSNMTRLPSPDNSITSIAREVVKRQSILKNGVNNANGNIVFSNGGFNMKQLKTEQDILSEEQKNTNSSLRNIKDIILKDVTADNMAILNKIAKGLGESGGNYIILQTCSDGKCQEIEITIRE